MRVKKIRVVRPVVEFTIERPILGRLLLPFFVVSVCWVARKHFVNQIEITLGGNTVYRYWSVLVPKFKVVDAE